MWSDSVDADPYKEYSRRRDLHFRIKEIITKEWQTSAAARPSDRFSKTIVRCIALVEHKIAEASPLQKIQYVLFGV